MPNLLTTIFGHWVRSVFNNMAPDVECVYHQGARTLFCCTTPREKALCILAPFVLRMESFYTDANKTFLMQKLFGAL